jgi:uncharacterized protein YecT (DUF1311 family)
MTIFRFSVGLLYLICAAHTVAAAPVAEPASPERRLEDCTPFAKEGPIAEYECVDRNNGRKEKRLEEASERARRSVEKRETELNSYMEDARRNPIYLDWAQAAWKQYAEQNCTVTAGALGGSNAWITRYWLDCYSEELDRRIKFLEELADGRLGEG